MSAIPISMRKIKEVLRLKFDAGLSQHQIAAALKISPGVVNKYLKAANAANITWPLPDDLSETQLRRKLFPPDTAPQPTFAQPDFAAIHQELKRTRLYPNYAAADKQESKCSHSRGGKLMKPAV